MPSVESIADAIVAREGGFVNDPDDPGGATKHGVTIGTLSVATMRSSVECLKTRAHTMS